MASSYDVKKTLALCDRWGELDLNRAALTQSRDESKDVPFSLDEPLHRDCEVSSEEPAAGVPPLADGTSGARGLEVSQRSLNMTGEGLVLPELASLPGLSGMNGD